MVHRVGQQAVVDLKSKQVFTFGTQMLRDVQPHRMASVNNSRLFSIHINFAAWIKSLDAQDRLRELTDLDPLAQVQILTREPHAPWHTAAPPVSRAIA